MPEIEVFLMFNPRDRNSHITVDRSTRKKTTTIEDGPDWKAIGVEVGRTGYNLTVHGPGIHPTVQQIEGSMNRAEVTLLIGHGGGTEAPGPKWISNQIKLSDGLVGSPDGVFVGRWNEDRSRLEDAHNTGKLKINKVTGIFTCNSAELLPGAFDIPEGSHLVTNDGGPDGLTRIGTLEAGAAEFVRGYARTKGDVSKAMEKAQFVFTRKGFAWASDAGDALLDRIGEAPKVYARELPSKVGP